MRVLIVDDNAMTVCGIKDHCDDMGWESEIIDFEQTYEKIMIFDPDVVVLDWCKEAGDNTAIPIFESIWCNGYRPVVIFSGNLDTIKLDEKYDKSAMLARIPKGDEQPVIDYLDNNLKYICVLAQYRKQMGVAIIESFKAIEPIRRTSEDYIGDEVLKYILAKRTASFFDIESTEQPLPPWGMYITPPVSPSLNVCDIIRVVSSDTDLTIQGNAQEYRIILTPSCDMVYNSKRQPKVPLVLCASCVDNNEFYERIKIMTSKIKGDSEKRRARMNAVSKVLTQGYDERWVPLPKMIGLCPCMTVDLKKTELIDLNEIAINAEVRNESTNFVRLASVDSPYREQIVWAHMQNSCRPGVPDRDVEKWARDIMS